jgi:hypothetical protein
VDSQHSADDMSSFMHEREGTAQDRHKYGAYESGQRVHASDGVSERDVLSLSDSDVRMVGLSSDRHAAYEDHNTSSSSNSRMTLGHVHRHEGHNTSSSSNSRMTYTQDVNRSHVNENNTSSSSNSRMTHTLQETTKLPYSPGKERDGGRRERDAVDGYVNGNGHANTYAHGVDAQRGEHNRQFDAEHKRHFSGEHVRHFDGISGFGAPAHVLESAGVHVHIAPGSRGGQMTERSDSVMNSPGMCVKVQYVCVHIYIYIYIYTFSVSSTRL